MSSPATIGAPPQPRTVSRRRFTVAEYYRMAEAGILTEDDRVELIDGEVLEMAPVSPRHVATVNRLNALLTRHSGTVITSVHNPVRLSDDTEPQPDLALLHYRADYYAGAHPTGDDVLLLIEVADTSLDYDRSVKLPRYGRAGIGEVWLVDLAGEVVEQYTDPRADQYGAKQTFGRGETIAARGLELSLAVDEILG